MNNSKTSINRNSDTKYPEQCSASSESSFEKEVQFSKSCDNVKSKRFSDSSVGESKRSSVKRRSSHRSVNSDEGAKRLHSARSSHTLSSKKPSFRESSNPPTRSGSVKRSSRLSTENAEAPTNNERRPSEHSFAQIAIDSAVEAGVALLRLVMQKSKRSSALSSREDVSIPSNDIPPWMQEGPPIRPAPLPPVDYFQDEVSMRSTTSLAGHTYEVMNFKDGGTIAPSNSINALNDEVSYENFPNDSGGICHPSSRKSSSRRKKRKCKTKATETVEDCFILNFNETIDDNTSSLGDIYNIPCPSPTESLCPTPPLRNASLYQDSEPKSTLFCTQLPVSPPAVSAISKMYIPITEIPNSEDANPRLLSEEQTGETYESTARTVPSKPKVQTTELPQSILSELKVNSSKNIYTKSQFNINPYSCAPYVQRTQIEFPKFRKSMQINLQNPKDTIKSAKKTKIYLKSNSCDGDSLSLKSCNTGSGKPSLLNRLRKSLRLPSFDNSGGSALDLNFNVGEHRRKSHRRASSESYLDNPYSRNRIRGKLDKAHSIADPVEDFKKFRATVPRKFKTLSHKDLKQLNSSRESTDTTSTAKSAECRHLEGEIRRLKEIGSHRLGSPSTANRRRHHRLHAINNIEKTIQRLNHYPSEPLSKSQTRSWCSNSDSNPDSSQLPDTLRDGLASLNSSLCKSGSSQGDWRPLNNSASSTATSCLRESSIEEEPSSSINLNPSPCTSHSTVSSECKDSSLGTWYEQLRSGGGPRYENAPQVKSVDSSKAFNNTNKNMDLVNANLNIDDTMDPDSLDSDLLPPDHTTPHSEGGNSLPEGDIPKLPTAIEAVLRGVWPFEKALWHSSPASVGPCHENNGVPSDPPGIMATSSVTNRRAHSQQLLLSNKVEMVYGLLSMFSSGDRADMSKTLLAMSSSPDSCVALRQSGCLPLIIQLLHGGICPTPGGEASIMYSESSEVPSRETRLRASQALHNVVHANTDEKRGRREARVLRLLEQIRNYSDYLYDRLEMTGAGQGPLLEDDMDRHPCPAMAAVMKLSFDEEHRLAMCTLGGLHAIAELVKRDHDAHGAATPDNFCITLRRYAGMALTNLTFGAGNNKALVCSFSGFLRSLVSQLNSPSQDLRQVISSVIRNLSWRADGGSKAALREAGAVSGLITAAMTAGKEATLKVILSAVWNLSAHCSVNKADICAVDGALAFICNSLSYKSQSRTLAIIENAGGILRNISSHIAVREELRQVLRDHNTLSVILGQLRSPSLTVVSNACGTLWNLSARCKQDQKALWDLGAVPMLRSLINSKHKMISMGSSAALKNLLQAKPEGADMLDSSLGLGLPSLQARRQRALEQELDQNLAETCDNIESSPRASPTDLEANGSFFSSKNECTPVNAPMYQSLDPRLSGLMTESRDSVLSTHSTRSDITHDRQMPLRNNSSTGAAGSSNGHRPSELPLNGRHSDEMIGQDHHSTAKATMNPSDPLYNLYNKYVAKNGKKKHSKDKVKVNNYVTDEKTTNAIEQPTDFSLRYSEATDEDPEKGMSGDEEAPKGKPLNRVKPNTSQEDYMGADDSVQTYFTEGTPLNFSTATSLSDIRGEGGASGGQQRLGTQTEEEEEEEDDEEEEEEISRFSSMSSLSSGGSNDRVVEEELEEDSDLQELVLKEGERVADAAAKAAGEPSPLHGENNAYNLSSEATPLMYSRTTSLGSLSSFPQQAVPLEDNGSIVSEFSRLASGIVSPSDLPDSPSQTMPTSPTRRHLTPSLGVFNDSPHTFKEEGTPCHMSQGTSLSSLTMDECSNKGAGDRMRGDGKDSSTNTPSPKPGGIPRALKSVNSRTSSIPRPQSLSSQDTHERSRSSDPHRGSGNSNASMPRPSMMGRLPRGRAKDKKSPHNISDSDGEKLLAQCITSGMPNSRSNGDFPPKAPSRSHSFVKSPRTPTLGVSSLVPPAPPPPPPPRLLGEGDTVVRASNIPINTVNIQVTTTTLNLGAMPDGDTLKTFCTEDTPANVSHAGSVTDLSGVPIESSDPEGILNRCIQSAMPKMKHAKGKPPSPRHVANMMAHQNKSARTTPMPSSSNNSVSSVSRKSNFGSSPQRRGVPVARVSPAIKQYPLLTRDQVKQSQHDEEVKNWGDIEGTPMGFSSATSLSDLTIDSPVSKGKVSARHDAPKRYATEDTPANLSRSDSLSSLSCDEGGQLTSRLRDDKKRPKNSVKPETDMRANGSEVPCSFNVEDTPAVLSRRSSLSSIDGMEKTPTKPATKAHVNYGTAVEGTPVCFSRNSSLSSLSVESYPEETTASEQALLEHCINQGMPQGDRPSRNVASSQVTRKTKQTSRIPGLSQSPGRSPARSPASNIPGVPLARLHLVPINDFEGESSKISSDLEQSEKRRRKEDYENTGAHKTDNSRPLPYRASGVHRNRGNNGLSSSTDTSSPEDRNKAHTSSSNGGNMVSDTSMTDSMIVATEALKLANVMERQGQEGRGSSDETSLMSQSITSENFLLENVTAPSAMECISLSASLTEEQKTPVKNKAMECRHTRKIPTMVRRALGDQQGEGMNGNGTASMASSCHSNLENVVPPSFMELDDMESSMISVASITSEVAEPRHSPPSMTGSLASEAMAAIEAPAHHIAKMLQQEARQLQSSVTATLTAGGGIGEDASTYHDVTDLEPDDTVNLHDATDTYHSADEAAGEIPDLPQDSPLLKRAARGTGVGSATSPQVTPSMLRKAVQNCDKYKTYTRSEKKDSSSSSRSYLSAKQRRSDDPDRFRTRVISSGGDEEEEFTSPVTPTVDNPMGSPRLKQMNKKPESRLHKGGFTNSPKHRGYKTPEGELIEFRDGAELDLTADQLEALSEDANIVICTLNENREANTTDLLNCLSQENILDIDTLSFISSDEDDGDNTFDIYSPSSTTTTSRPRIIKPGKMEEEPNFQEDDGVGKGIRGRRKGLYPGARKATTGGVSRVAATPAAAFKPAAIRGGAQAQTSPSSHNPQSPGSPKVPRATRASALRQKARGVSSSSSSPASSAGSSPRIGMTARTKQHAPPPQTHTTQPAPLKRQNTFTKEDQEEAAATPSPQTPKTPLGAKPRFKREMVQPTPAAHIRPVTRAAAKSLSLNRDAVPPSANDMAEWSKGGAKGAKKDVTSRIASLWKKVEKAQSSASSKSKGGNDARVWINNKKCKTPTEVTPPPLVRSSTYEKLEVNGEASSNESGVKNKTKLALKLSRLRGNKSSKSSPPSEANTPTDSTSSLSYATARSHKDAASSSSNYPPSKRISRLGSFVDPENDSSGACDSAKIPQSAKVAPFNYQPPRSRSNSSGCHEGSKTPGGGSDISTRIPLPHKTVVNNSPRDDNGNDRGW